MRPLSLAFFPLAATLLAAPALHAQTMRPYAPPAVTAADYARAERRLAPAVAPLVSGTMGRPTWLDDGRITYRATTADGGTYLVVDPATGARTAAFDAARLAAALTTATGRPVEANRLPAQGLTLGRDGRSVRLVTASGTFTCDLAAYTCVAAPATPPAPGAPPNSSLSPDGTKAVFIRMHNLWMRDLATGTETALTTDGVENFGYATDNAGWTHSDRPVLTWAPDGKSIATFQHDGRGVGTMTLVSTNVGHPRVETWAYPLPGDSAVFRLHRVVVRLPEAGTPARVVRLAMEPDYQRSTVSDHVACGGEICDLQWSPDSRRLGFLSVSRDHKTATLRMADPATGAVRTVLEERSNTQVGDASFPENLWHILGGRNEAIWWSQAEDWTHLYLVDLATGRTKNKITSGEGNVTSIVRIDEAARVLYVMAQGKESGRDPYFQHLYRVGLDGSGWTLLTPENAHHTVTLSPDGATFLDTYSTPDTPPVTVLRRLDGTLVSTLERGDVSRLAATGWKAPTPIRVKARDGRTDLYGLMYTPTNLDRTRRYPIVNYIYPGPQTGSVGTRSFVPARGDHQALAELGFVVVQIDGMGTPGRSKTFADAYYGRMYDNTIPDQVAGMKDLARQFAFVDTTRVGIWGHSGGGFATAAAMFAYPDFFDVGISESGNHENRNYEDDWGERYQGLLTRTGTTDNYAAEATPTHAGRLKGKLMIAHGLMDDNVPPSNSLLLVDALVKANKDFDLVVFPNARHGFGADGMYMMRRRWDYFVRHLLGVEPPKEYRIGAPRR